MDFQQSDDGRIRELALFAGAGGGILASHLIGWRTVCAVERDAYPAQVLAQRQNDGILEPFPVWSDVQTFDGTAWRGLIDVVSGGFPCQDISSAGRGAGIQGSKSSMWKHMARIIGEVRPKFAYMENSPLLVGRGLAVVISDLAEMGYDAVWGVLGAADMGAPHKRDRIWILAHTEELQRNGSHDNTGIGVEREAPSEPRDCSGPQNVAHANGPQLKRNSSPERIQQEYSNTSGPGWWEVEPRLDRMADGLADRVDRLKAIGNGQVPRVAAEAFNRLIARS